MEIRRMTSEEAKKLKFPEMSEEERRAFIKRNNDLEGKYLDDEEREIMEAYNGGARVAAAAHRRRDRLNLEEWPGTPRGF